MAPQHLNDSAKNPDWILEAVGLGHRYGPIPVFENLDLRLALGERLAIVGPSGCGKSTLLRLCAGLETPRDGRAERRCRRLSVVFQDPVLLPWKRTRINIELPLKASGEPPRQRRQRSAQIAHAFGLTEEDLDKFPLQLSGGMRHRAALARAFSTEPDLVFLDEPFSALDVGLKEESYRLLLKTEGVTFFLITHDIVEAVRLADRILLLGPKSEGWLGAFDLGSRNRDRSPQAAHAQALELLATSEAQRCFGLPPNGASPTPSAL